MREDLKSNTYWEMDSLNVSGKCIMLITTACDKHVPEVESYIHTIKERAQATINTLTFENAHIGLLKLYTMHYSCLTASHTKMAYAQH